MSEEKKDKISFADLDTFLKIAPVIGLALLTYLQTLFPSKAEFDKLEQHLIQMDKKITEMTVLQQAITGNTTDLRRVTERIRLLELEVAKHNAQASSKTNKNNSRTVAAKKNSNNSGGSRN
jgi:hypothetical protein